MIDLTPDVPHLDGNPVSELEGRGGKAAHSGVQFSPNQQSGIFEVDAQSPAPAYTAELSAESITKGPRRDGAVGERSTAGTELLEGPPESPAMLTRPTRETEKAGKRDDQPEISGSASDSRTLNSELQALVRREADLQARRAALLELQQIQAEEDQIRQRIRALQEGSRPDR